MELRYLLEMLWRRKRIFCILFLAVFLTLVVVTLRMPTSYHSTAKVYLNKSTATMAFLQAIGIKSASASTTLSSTDLNDYEELIASGPLLDDFIEALQLTRDRRSIQLIRMIPLTGYLLDAVGLSGPKARKPVAREELMNPGLLNILFPSPKIQTEIRDDTSILRITATSCDYLETIAMANTLSELFVQDEITRIKKDFARVRAYVNSNLTTASSEYQQAMAGVRQLKTAYGSLSISGDITALGTEINRIRQVRNTAQINRDLTRSALRARRKTLEATPVFAKTSEQLKENSVLATLRQTMSDLQVDLARSRTEFTDEHPEVTALHQQIENVKKQIEAERLKVFSSETVTVDPLVTELIKQTVSDEADIDGYTAQIESCNERIRELESLTDEYIRRSSEMNRALARELAAEDVYKTLLQFEQQVAAAELMAIGNLSIVEPAVVSSKIGKHKSPSVLINSIIGLLLASFFGFCGVVALEYTDPCIRNIDDLSKEGAYPIRAVVPDHTYKSRLFPKVEKRVPYRILMRKLYGELSGSSRNIVGFMSLKDKAGCTTVVSGLAEQCAAGGKKTLVIHLGDNSHPELSASGGIQKTLADLPPQAIEAEKLFDEGDSHFIQVSVGHDVSGEELMEKLQDIKDGYDLIIVDISSTRDFSAALEYVDACEAYLFVIRPSQTSRAAMERVAELTQPGLHCLGVVLNKTRPEWWSLISRERIM